MVENQDNGDQFRRGSKYRQSMKTLLPYRAKKKTGHPVDNAGFFSTLFFSWLTGLVVKLFRKPVRIQDLWETPKNDMAEPNCKRFLRFWDEEVKVNGRRASLKRAFIRTIRTRIIICCACTGVYAMTMFLSNGVVVRYLLEYVQKRDGTWQIGLALVGTMFVCDAVRAMGLSTVFAISLRNAVRCRASVLLAVFEKMLRVPPNETSSIGEIVNMCSSDGDRIFEAVYLTPIILGLPVVYLCGLGYLCFMVGPIALLGCLVFIVIILIQLVLLKLLNFLRAKAVRYTDARVNNINEVLSSIKFIKMYAWEESFSKVIGRIRDKERRLLQWSAFIQSFNMSLAGLTPYAATIVTVVVMVLTGKDVTSSQAFTCLTLFNVMAFTLRVTPVVLKNVAEASVALDRIENVMKRKEYSNYVKTTVSSSKISIELVDATLAWPSADDKCENTELKNKNGENKELLDGESAEKQPVVADKLVEDIPSLYNISMSVEKGSLVGVCGQVGSGKSSLISAILGQLVLKDGSVAISGSPAYCAQQAWIMNATIRDNIIFGLPFDEVKYNKIIEDCCLLPDFEIFASGDLTEVGERGINLSGGQKQRINLARALYMDREIYLLDDPLSAVDAHVGKKLFENVILALKKRRKTIVLVTHWVEYLPYCDVIALLKEGKIWEYGTHDDLLDRGEEYYQLHRIWYKQKESVEDPNKSKKGLDKKHHNVVEGDIANEKVDEKKALEEGRLMTSEETAKGAISSQTYGMYLKAAGGWLAIFLLLMLIILYTCSLQFANMWLSYWLKQGSGSNMSVTSLSPERQLSEWQNTTSVYELLNVTEKQVEFGYSVYSMRNPGRVIDNPQLNFYLTVFGIAIAANIAMSVVKGYIFSLMSIRASHRLYTKLFKKILYSTMEFFDTTPIGRILNRFQKDQDMLDSVVPFLFEIVLTFFTFLVSCIVFIAYVFPYFLVVIAVIAPIFLIAFYLFKSASREMRRQDNLSRSPWFSHIVTTITGISTVRAYDKTNDFIARFTDLLDTNSIPFFLYAAVNRWLVTRLDIIACCIVVICCIFIVLSQSAIPAAFAGLAISSSLMMTTIFQFTTKTSVEAESNFVAAERIVHYIKTVPSESHTPEKKDLNEKWPSLGAIHFCQVNMRYRDGLPLVLRDVSITINEREKIGVVGRTGSGKSSLGVALFRLVNLASGSISIDGIDITHISLHQLRSRLSIIPQEPVLFTGTVRYNIDPFNQHSDDTVWESLEHTHLKETILQLPKQLETPVSENGGNFSVGERQLMCLARALLRRNKILLLDEATASIDTNTDNLVQTTINERFFECTVITIAHRLHTVMSCDRILVLDQGHVVEFDTPQLLSSKPDSHLSKLLESASS